LAGERSHHRPPGFLRALLTEQARILRIEPQPPPALRVRVLRWWTSTVLRESAPQLVEVSDGSMSLMEGSDACGKCDPPFANSSAAFHSYQLPLIAPALEPWLGTFGGPGHDHREEVLVQGVKPPPGM